MNIEGNSSRERFLLTFFRLFFAVALLLTTFAASPRLVPAEESERPETASGHQGAAEEHGESHHHKNHVAFFVGSVEGEEHHGEKGDWELAVGVDYERRLSEVVGVGLLADWVPDREEYMIGVPLFLHAGRYAKFELAPSFRHLSHTGEDDFVFRTGFLLDFTVGKMTLSPGIFYDIAEGQDFLAFGLGVGTGF